MDGKTRPPPHRQAPPDQAAAEAARLSALRRYAILDTGEEPAFDRIAALARDLLGTPIAMVSLIDETRQWFKARIGLEIREVPREVAFCDHTIQPEGHEGVLVVPDLSADPRFAANPLVVGGPGFRFYAGAPIVAPGGECIGTVSALSTAARPEGVSDAQRRCLRSLAALAADELELRLQTRLAREAAAHAAATAAELGRALAAEARLRHAQEAAGVVAFEFGTRGISEAGPALRALFGLPRQGALDFPTLLAAVHPDDRGALSALWTGLRAAGGSFEHELRVVRPDGVQRWLQLRGAMQPPRTDAPPGVVVVAGVAQDITERRAAEEVRSLLAREVDHRAKNALAVVQAALRLTPKDDPAVFAAAIEGRIAALARAHALLAQERWAAAGLRAIVEGELQPFLRDDGTEGRAHAVIAGPHLSLAPHAVQPMAMAVHELATNAIKHGALGASQGQVEVSWTLDPAARRVLFRWVERGGPSLAGPPERRGFGSRLLETTVERQLGGTLDCRWDPEGLTCDISLATERILARG